MNAQVFDTASYHLTPYAAAPLIVGVLMVLLAIATLIKERTSGNVSLAFTLMLVSGAVWLLGYGFVYSADQEAVALGWIKVTHMGVCLIPSTVFLFAVVITRRARAWRYFIFSSFLISLGFLALGVGTDRFITGLYRYFWGYYARYGPFSFPFLIFFFSMLLISLGLLWSEYRRAVSERQKQRLKWFVIALSVAYFGALDFLPAYGIAIYPLGYLSILAYVGITGWALQHYHLVDITPAFAVRQIIANMAEALLVFDRDGIVRLVNNLACQLLGRPEEEIIGKEISSVTLGAIRIGEFDTLIYSQQSHGYEVSYASGEGSEKILNISASLVQDQTGKPAAVVCLIRDISDTKKLEREREIQTAELKRANQELEEREKVMMSLLEDLQASREMLSQLADIVESSEDAIISKNLAGIIQSWNKGAEKLYGYRAAEVKGQPISILIPPEHLEETTHILARIKKGESVGRYETVRVRKDGRKIDVLVSISPMKDVLGQIVGVSAITRDITDRKRAEELLKRNEERIRLIIETANDAFIEIDAKGLITDWNRQAEIIFGWKREEVMDRPLAEIIIPPSQREAHLKGLQKAAVTGEGPILNKRIEISALRRSGREFPVELYVWPLRTAGVCRFNAFVRDITERKYAEASLLQKTAELARASAEREYMELFASAASHDLQEPLHKILAFGDLLKRRGDETGIDDTLKDYIERMQNAAIRMSQLIEALLQFSRQATKEEPREEVDLENIVHEVLSDLELRIAQSKARIDVGKLPMVLASKIQMHEVFQNLIANALKFHKKGECPKVTIESRTLADGSVDVMVQDHGVGFDEKYANEIFKPFRRLHTRSEFEGSGIGLAICQKIVLRNGGKLTAKSSPGKGSTFIVTLPVCEKNKIKKGVRGT